jgi:hypothetical protein
VESKHTYFVGAPGILVHNKAMRHFLQDRAVRVGEAADSLSREANALPEGPSRKALTEKAGKLRTESAEIAKKGRAATSESVLEPERGKIEQLEHQVDELNDLIETVHDTPDLKSQADALAERAKTSGDKAAVSRIENLQKKIAQLQKKIESGSIDKSVEEEYWQVRKQLAEAEKGTAAGTAGKGTEPDKPGPADEPRRSKSAREEAAAEINDQIEDVRSRRAKEVKERQEVLEKAKTQGEKVNAAYQKLEAAREAALKDKSKIEEFRQAKKEYEPEKAKLEALNDQLEGYRERIDDSFAQEKALEDALAEGKRREVYMGKTPGKGSKTGLEVQRRMRLKKTLMPDPVTGEMKFLASDGKWYPLEMADMTHVVDAVKWWNETGRKFGARADEVLKWMQNADNYTLDHFSRNRSAGAKVNEEYLPPLRK